MGSAIGCRQKLRTLSKDLVHYKFTNIHLESETVKVIQRLFFLRTRQFTGDWPTHPVTFLPLFQSEIGCWPSQPLAVLPLTHSVNGFIPIQPDPCEPLIRILIRFAPHQLETFPVFGICVVHCQKFAEDSVGKKMLKAAKQTASEKANLDLNPELLRISF